VENRPPILQFREKKRLYPCLYFNAERLFQELPPELRPPIKGISDATGYLLDKNGLPWQQLFSMWKTLDDVAQAYYHDRIMHTKGTSNENTIFSNSPDNLFFGQVYL